MTYEARMMRHLPSLLTAALVAAVLIPPSGFGQVVGERAVAHTPIGMTPTNPNPLAPHLVLNEVLFDTPGAAGSEGAYQWVELYAHQSVHLAGVNVENAPGQPLVGLPPVTVPAGTHVVALLGPKDASLDNLDPEQGPIVITAGLAWADYLGVRQGGVRITRNAKLLDSLSWSTTPPSDAFFDLGAQPIHEGDSLGRNASSAYSGKATDFAVSGGANATGPTPGSRNIVPLPDSGELLLVGDYWINQVFTGLSMTDDGPGWLQVLSSSPSILDYQQTTDVAQTAANHSFLVDVYGSQLFLTGTSTITFQRDTTASATAEAWDCEGSLVSPGGSYELQFLLHHDSSGFHGPTITVQYASSCDWSEFGQSYPVGVSGTRTLQHQDPDTIVITDSRTGWDHGGAGTKTASSTTTDLRIADGTHKLTVSAVRSFPSLPPTPGADQIGLPPQTETLYEECVVTTDGLGTITQGTITAFDQRVDGVVVRALQSGATGTITSSLTTTGSDLSYAFRESLPIVDGMGDSCLMEVAVDATVTNLQGKELTSGSLSVHKDGATLYSVAFSFDPSNGGDRDGDKSLGAKIMGALDTTITCAVSGGAGSLAASTKAGAKAAVKLVGKAAAKKAVPVIGWGLTAWCLAKGIFNEFF